MTILELIEPVARLVAEALLNGLWQGVALAALVGLLLSVLKRINATTRYAIWWVTLLAVVCLPLFAGRVPDLPSAPASWFARLPAAPGVHPHPHSDRQGPVADWPVDAPIEAPASTGSFQGARRVEGSQSAATLLLPVKLPGPWALILLGGLLVAASISTLRVIVSYLHLRRLKCASSELAPEYQQRLEPWIAAYCKGRAVRLCSSDEVALPMVVGLVDPVILIPRSLAEQLSEDEFDLVGLHELGHLRRWDDWTNLIQKLIEAAFFFHPAVLWIGRQLDLEREIACDDWVISTTGRPRPYAACLTKLVELTRQPQHHYPAPGAVTLRKQISRRIELLLDRQRNAAPRLSATSFLAALGTLIALTVLGTRLAPVIALPETASDTFEDRYDQFAVRYTEEEPPVPEEEQQEIEIEAEAEEARAQAQIEQAAERVAHTSARVRSADGSVGIRLSDGQKRIELRAGGYLKFSDIGEGDGLPLKDQRGMTATIIRSVASLDSDEDKAIVLAAMARTSGLDRTLFESFFEAVRTIDSSSDRRHVLSEVMKHKSLDKQLVSLVLESARDMDTDEDKADVLVTVAKTYSLDEMSPAFLEAVETIDATENRRRVLSEVLIKGTPRPEILTQLLESVQNIDSDADKAALLIQSAKLPDGAGLAPAFFEAVETIDSSSDKQQVLSAVLNSGLSNKVLIQMFKSAESIDSDADKAALLIKAASVCPDDDVVLSAFFETAETINSSDDKRRALFALLRKDRLG
ncbi:MAG: M56 family metallopeptidase [Gemmatimonadaceae bacterium]|nr:M56 family metallopeptidase [Gloeobacterales cyanobacterium ES-bin-141]